MNKCWQGCGEKRTLVHFWCECKLVQALWTKVWSAFKKLKIELPYDPIVPLGIYLKNMQTQFEKTYVFFISSFFTVAKLWKQLGSIDRWMAKVDVV